MRVPVSLLEGWVEQLLWVGKMKVKSARASIRSGGGTVAWILVVSPKEGELS